MMKVDRNCPGSEGKLHLFRHWPASCSESALALSNSIFSRRAALQCFRDGLFGIWYLQPAARCLLHWHHLLLACTSNSHHPPHQHDTAPKNRSHECTVPAASICLPAKKLMRAWKRSFLQAELRGSQPKSGIPRCFSTHMCASCNQRASG